MRLLLFLTSILLFIVSCDANTNEKTVNSNNQERIPKSNILGKWQVYAQSGKVDNCGTKAPLNAYKLAQPYQWELKNDKVKYISKDFPWDDPIRNYTFDNNNIISMGKWLNKPENVTASTNIKPIYQVVYLSKDKMVWKHSLMCVYMKRAGGIE